MKVIRLLGALLALVFIQAQVSAQVYNWTTIAGTNGSAAYGDGTNYTAYFNRPTGTAVDANGNVYIADAGNFVIREISPVNTNWVSKTLAGLAGSSGFLDGSNSVARFSNLSVLQIDSSGKLYAIDNGRIRRIALVGTNWVVTTIYTQASGGWAADTSGNFYTGSNDTIIQLSVPSGGQTSPSNFVATVLAGTPGSQGTTDGTNNIARFFNPYVFNVDSLGTIYLSDNASLRKVYPSVGNWVAATLSANSYSFTCRDVAGNFYSVFDQAIYMLPAGTNIWTSIGGVAFPSGDVDGTNSVARFSSPEGLSVNGGRNIFVADSANDTIRMGAIVPIGSLQVFITPTGAITAGAQWQVDGGAWQTNGVILTNLLIGNHTVAFSTNFGWTTPVAQTATIYSNQLTTITGVYTQQFGSLQVTLGPAGAVTAGAEWQVDGGTLQASGAVISSLPLGTHVVSYLPVPGFITPTNNSVVVAFNQTTNITANYTALGSVQVTIFPTNAVTSGALWQLDGGAFQSSGVTISNVSLGSHTIAYFPIPGWLTPSNQSVTVVSGQTTNVSGTYIATGSVQTFIVPVGAGTAGARWRLDASAWQTNGAVVMAVTAGSHTVSFTNLPGWTTPTNQIVVVSLNQTSVVTGVYVQLFGSLQVVLSPLGAVIAGAQWQVDSGTWQSSGTTLTNVSVGSHTLGFLSLADWAAPANQTISISSNQTTRVTAIYQGQGSLQVFLSPTGAISSGAAWQIDGGAWMANGTTVTALPLGNHTVSFSAASGWLAPSSQTVAILASQVTVANGFYTTLQYGYSTISGAAGNSGCFNGTNLHSLFNTPVGIAVDANTNVFIADTGNSVIRQLTFTTNGWIASTIAGLADVPGNSDGTNSQARFDYPTGIAVDSSDNLYVADQVNSTIRKLNTDGTNWYVTTIAGSPGNYGTNDGLTSAARFYYPSGVAVDSSGYVYVADQINSTIRIIVPESSNTWYVATIAGSAGVNGNLDGTNTAATFYWPGDLACDTNGNLFVADTFNNTIREISVVGGSYVTTTICGAAGLNGSVDGSNNVARFDGPAGIAVDSHDNLYVVDSYSSVVRKITSVGTNWAVNTVGGLAYHEGTADGTNAFARFDTPSGISVDANGLPYISDTDNQTIRLGSFVAPLPLIPSLTVIHVAQGFGFNWQAVIGSPYQVQFKTNLLQPAWLDLGAAVPATNLTMPFVDPSPTNLTEFYRVTQVQ